MDPCNLCLSSMDQAKGKVSDLNTNVIGSWILLANKELAQLESIKMLDAKRATSVFNTSILI